MWEKSDIKGLLIDLIQNYEYLYNLQNRFYKNNNMKEQAWREISAILEIDAEECKRLWKSLRDKYTREKRESSKSGSAAPESSWEYFDRMHFYGKYTKPRKSYTSVPPSGERSSSSCSAWSTYEQLVSPEPMVLVEEIQDTQDQVHIQDQFNTERQSESNTQTQLGNEEVATPSANPSTPKLVKSSYKRKQDTSENEFVAVAKEIASGLSNMKKQKTNPNSTLAEYIYSELEEMPQEEARKKRKDLLNVLNN